MKKSTSIIVALVLVFSVILAIVPATVSANPGSVLAQGNWVYPSTGVIAIEKTAKRYGIPRHLQLITEGMEFTFKEPTVICHGFYGAGKGWVPEFRYFWNYRWNAIKPQAYITTEPETGNVLACVKAPFSATYALFGYYPQNQTEADLPQVSVESVYSGSGQWNVGTEKDIDLLFAPAPDYLKVYSRGVVIGKEQWQHICHPFKEGLNGWAADIRQYKDDRWVPIKTEESIMPPVEGINYACAWVGEGTYQLFGYLK